MAATHRLARAELEAGLEEIRRSPHDKGVVELIVIRPAVDVREVVQQGTLDPVHGLLGDTWSTRGSRLTADGSPHRDMQLTIMNSRAIRCVAGGSRNWPPAGDQLFVDLDLSFQNLPPGTRLTAGTAVIEVSHQPHTGCGKFAARFGAEATRFVNSEIGRQLNLRGINCKIIQGGIVQVGDVLKKLPRL